MSRWIEENTQNAIDFKCSIIMTRRKKNKAGRKPLPAGWKGIYCKVSPESAAILQAWKETRKIELAKCVDSAIKHAAKDYRFNITQEKE